MIWRYHFTTLLLLLGTVLRADSLATLTVIVPRLEGARTAFEIYERNKYDRVIARADSGQDVSLAPDRYNVRVIEESRRGLREVWRHNIEVKGKVRLKAGFGPPTVRVRIIDNITSTIPHGVVFRSRKKHQASYPLPFNAYTRLPTGWYSVEVLKENRVVSTSKLSLERELDGILLENLTVKWVVEESLPGE